jgi:putative drug exporter of the RND superfamily
MKLLGDRNWYLPRWLAWLPAISVEVTHEKPAERVLVPNAVTEG